MNHVEGSVVLERVQAWLVAQQTPLQNLIPAEIERIKGKAPERLNLTLREPSETTACHVSGTIKDEIGLPPGYRLIYDGELLIFDPKTGDYLEHITPHLFFAAYDSEMKVHVLDLFAAQAFFSDSLPTRRGAANQQMRNLVAQNILSLLTEVGNGIVALHGTVEELQSILGLEHMTMQGYFKKYGVNGIVYPHSIPNMFRGLSDQQSDHRR